MAGSERDDLAVEPVVDIDHAGGSEDAQDEIEDDIHQVDEKAGDGVGEGN